MRGDWLHTEARTGAAQGATRGARCVKRTRRRSPSYGPAEVELLRRIGAERVPSIVRAAELMVDAISRDRAVYVYGSGHSVIPLVDIFPRYGSFAGFRPLLDRA